MRSPTEFELIRDLLSPPMTGLRMGITQRGVWCFYEPFKWGVGHEAWTYSRPLTDAEIEAVWPYVEAEKVSVQRGPTAGAVVFYPKIAGMKRSRKF